MRKIDHDRKEAFSISASKYTKRFTFMLTSMELDDLIGAVSEKIERSNNVETIRALVYLMDTLENAEAEEEGEE